MSKILFSISLILIVSLISCNSKSADMESAKNDSINKYLELASNDNLDFRKRAKSNLIANGYLSLTQNSFKKRNNLYNVSRNYIFFDEKLKFKTSSEELLNLSIESKDSINQGKAYLNLALYYMDVPDNLTALNYLFKSEKIFLKMKIKDYLGEIYLNKAFLYVYENDYTNCESSASKALLNLSEKENNRRKYDSYNLIAVSSNELKNYNKAIEYHQKALKVAQAYLNSNKNNLIANSYNNLGVVYQNLNQNTKAIHYFQKALKQKSLFKQSPDLYAMLLDNLGYSLLKNKKDRNVSILLYKALRIREEHHIYPGIIASKLHLSEFYFNKKNAILSKKNASEALSIAEKLKTTGDILSSLNQLATIDKANSYYYLKKYIWINDSLQVAERQMKDKFARIAYETDEITQEKENAIKQRWVVSVTSIIIILLVLIILVITDQKSKEKEIQLLKRQQKANEEIYTLLLIQNDIEDEARRSEKIRIAQELHDGVMNRLSSTRLNLDILKYRTDDETIKKCLLHIEELYLIEQEIRNISHDLNIEAFTNSNSFSSLLENLISKLNEISTTSYKIEMSPTIFWNMISSNIKINIYRIIQESCSNINKFAKAQNATISLTLDENNLCLSITDDGQGFDTETKSAGIGLKNIEQRVEMLNGDFFIQSIKNKSTSINIAIPIL